MPTTTLRLAILITASLVSPTWADEPKKELPAKPLTFTTPKGWEKLAPGKSDLLGLTVAARFRSGEGEKAVAVAVVGLDGDGGGLANNVNRWRNQVGLDNLDEKDALKALQPVKIDGLPGHLLDVTGADAKDKPAQRIVVALVRRGEHTVYAKMSGPGDAVEKQKASFDGFVKSIRFGK